MLLRLVLLLVVLCSPAASRKTAATAAGAKPVYSWYHCIQRCNPTQDTCDYEANWKVTSCHFKNVCVDTSTQAIQFFRDPEAAAASVHTDEFYNHSAGFPSPLAYLAGGNMAPAEDPEVLAYADVVNEPFPQKDVFSLPGPVVYMAPFTPDNFGHCLADNAFPAFRLLRRFGLAKQPATILFNGYDLEQECAEGSGACRNIRNIFNPALTKAPVHSLGFGPLQPSSNKYACTKDLVVGFGKLGMYSDSDVWDQFNVRLMKAAGLSEQNVPRRHKIVIFLKKGRRSTTNIYPLARHLKQTFNIKVQVADIAKMSYVKQAKLVNSATVVISPCGGLSFSSVFLAKRAAAIYVCTWDPNAKLQLQIERFWYDRQSRFQALYYPVEESELVINTTYAVKGAGSDHILTDVNLYRNFADVTVSLPKMVKVVHTALHLVELGMGWDLSYERPPIPPPSPPSPVLAEQTQPEPTQKQEPKQKSPQKPPDLEKLYDTEDDAEDDLYSI